MTRASGIVYAFGVAIGVLAVVSLGVVTTSLQSTDLALLRTGNADFTVAQKGVSEIIYSSIDNGQLQAIRSIPGVETAVGVLIETEHINSANPIFIEIGIPPDQLANFGVKVVAGQPFTANAPNE